MGKAWAEAIKIFEEETGATVEFEEKSFEQIRSTASQVLELRRGARPHGVQQGQRHRGPPRQHRACSPTSPTPSTSTAGTTSSPRRCRPPPSTTKTASWARRHLVRRPELRRVRRRLLQQGRVRRGRPRGADHLRRVRRRARRVRRAGHHAARRGRRRVPARPALVPARAERRPTASSSNDYQLYENPVDWQGDELTYATETLAGLRRQGLHLVRRRRRSRPRTRVSRSSTARRRSSSRARGGSAASSPRRPASTWTSSGFPERDLSLGSSGNLWVVPENAANKELAYEFIDITMRPEIQAIIGNNGGVPVAADPADITDEKSAELIATFNAILEQDGLVVLPRLADAELLRRARRRAAGPRQRHARRPSTTLEQPRRASTTTASPTSRMTRSESRGRAVPRIDARHGPAGGTVWPIERLRPWSRPLQRGRRGRRDAPTAEPRSRRQARLARLLALPHPRPRCCCSVIIIIPLVWNVFLSFTEWRGIRPPEFIGLENWHRAPRRRGLLDVVRELASG